ARSGRGRRRPGGRAARRSRARRRAAGAACRSSRRARLAPLPDGCPLLPEGAQPLDAVLGGEGDAERLDLVAAPRLDGTGGGEGRRAFRLAERDRSLGGESGG